jgi:hypothetical protein
MYLLVQPRMRQQWMYCAVRQQWVYSTVQQSVGL